MKSTESLLRRVLLLHCTRYADARRRRQVASLAGFAARVVDGAELHVARRHGGCRVQGLVRVFMARGNGVELAPVYGAHLHMRGALRAQVVGGLEAAQPGELVGLVELLARGA